MILLIIVAILLIGSETITRRSLNVRWTTQQQQGRGRRQHEEEEPRNYRYRKLESKRAFPSFKNIFSYYIDAEKFDFQMKTCYYDKVIVKKKKNSLEFTNV